MPEENQNKKKTAPYTPYILLGDKYNDEDTEQAVKILDEVGFPYRYAHCNSLNGPMPQLISGLQSWVGLGQVGRAAKQYKRRHSLEKTVSTS